MDATQTLDSELLGDWALLNDHQKKAVLDLVKAFANAESDWWDEIEEKAASSNNKGLQQARTRHFSRRSDETVHQTQ